MRNSIQHHSASKIIPNVPSPEMSAQAPLACALIRRSNLVRLITSGEPIIGRLFKLKLQ